MSSSADLRPPTLADIDAGWDFQQPGVTEARFKSWLPAARTGDPAVLVELLTQIARTASLQRRFDEAHGTLDEAEQLLAGLGDKGSRPRIRLLLERGRTFNSSKRKDQALPLFIEAWELGCSIKEEGLAVDAAHMVAIAQEGAASLEWNLKALELARRSEQPAARKWLGSLTNNLGWSYHDLGEHEKALASFEESAQCYVETQKPWELSVAKWAMARQVRALGRVEEALAAQLILAAEGEAAGKPSGFTQEEIGECLMALGRSAEAAPHFAKAYELLTKDTWFVANEPARLERLRELSRL